MKQVVVYTDGACSGNPGPGGWAAILRYGEHQREMSGFVADTTNNRMEISAALEALEALLEPCEVTLYSDSSYLVNATRKGWLVNWQRNGWLTSQKKPVENQDLWQKLIVLCQKHKVRFERVPGHADCEENNRCDLLARTAVKEGLRKGPAKAADSQP